MILTQKITTPIAVQQFDLEETPLALFLQFRSSRDSLIYVCLYDSSDELIGNVNFGIYHFPTVLCYAQDRFTMNVRPKMPQKGTYKLCVFSPFPADREANDLELEISILRDEAALTEIELMSEDYFQEMHFFEDKMAKTIIMNKQRRYYKGDFHGHSFISDGAHTAKQVGEVLTKQNMDFMALTEHNTVAFGYKHTQALLIPSYELTLPKGHLNIHGLENPDLFASLIAMNSQANSKLLTEEALYSAILNQKIDDHKGKCNISLNHMFLEPWEFTFESMNLNDVNTIEVMCDPTYPTSPEANDKTVSFLDYLWQKNFKIYGIGGSDSHSTIDKLYENATLPSIYGDPSTYVYCEGLSTQNIINGIQKGHAYVTRLVNLEIEIGNGLLLPGDEISDLFDFAYSVKVHDLDVFYTSNSNRFLEGRFILNGDVIQSKQIRVEENEMKLENIVEILKERELINHFFWIRYGLYDSLGHVVAYVNPIYFGFDLGTKHEISTIGHHIEMFENAYDGVKSSQIVSHETPTAKKYIEEFERIYGKGNLI